MTNAVSLQYGNRVLYRMCEESPYHTDVEVVRGKIWLIGRAYNAAFERGVAKSDDDATLLDKVAKAIAESEDMQGVRQGAILDKKIQALSKLTEITPDNIHVLLDLHGYLEDIFYRVAGRHRISLTSKYLHFHVPHLVFIFDSKTLKAIQKVITEEVLQNEDVIYQLVDWEETIRHRLERQGMPFCQKYLDFCVQCLHVYSKKRKETPQFTPRALDNLLLNQNG